MGTRYRRPKTTTRGLGAAHQQARRAALKKLRPGEPCPFTWVCGGLPMFATPAEAARAGLHHKLWHLDLDDYPGRVFGGPQVKRLAHRHCNRKAGAITGNKLRAKARPTAYTRW